MTTKKTGPCTKTKRCAGMAYALDRPDRRDRTGFDFANVFDMKTGQFTPLGYLYRRTSKDAGIVMNLCPFCGADYAALWPRAPAEGKGTTTP